LSYAKLHKESLKGITYEKSAHSIIKPIAFIGNDLPRHCGTVTFTTDLGESLADQYKGTACIAISSRMLMQAVNTGARAV
jgi:hypothetical protein